MAFRAVPDHDILPLDPGQDQPRNHGIGDFASRVDPRTAQQIDLDPDAPEWREEALPGFGGRGFAGERQQAAVDHRRDRFRVAPLPLPYLVRFDADDPRLVTGR